MAYDNTPTNSNLTGLIAPQSIIKDTVNFWKGHGFAKEKIMLGVPSYARTFTLKEDCDIDKMEVATDGPGVPGTYTKEAGFLSYYELLVKLGSNRYKQKKHDTNYYACYNKEWLSYDLKDTYEEKAKYAKSEGLGGMMVWTIDTDDFTGKSSKNEKYPILETLNRILKD